MSRQKRPDAYGDATLGQDEWFELIDGAPVGMVGTRTDVSVACGPFGHQAAAERKASW